MDEAWRDDHPKRVALVSTYPPRRCGLATFSQDLRAALLGVAPDWGIDVAAVDRDGMEYGDEVLTVIEQDSAQSYLDAAAVIAAAGTDIVVIEHEYGIFGGTDGRFVVGLATQLRRRGVPYVVTTHTVPMTPTPGQASTLRALCDGAAAVTAFTAAARRTLVEAGLTDAGRVVVIPHGVPPVLLDPGAADPPGPDLVAVLARLAEDPMLTTFGLISPGKGLEQAISALPMIVARHPQVRYVIAGTTHPEVLRSSGEAYRHGLTELSRRLGVAGHVVFVDMFLSESELAHLLARTTIYLTPYRGMEQTCSGTLAFAIAAGCPVVSTPYQYAREMLSGQDGVGVLVPPGDPAAIASAVSGLLDDPGRLARAHIAGRIAGARLDWSVIAARFAEVLAACPDRTTRRLLPAPVPVTRLPLRTGHLHALIDDIGIIQFARDITPDPGSGYCVDDMARLAVVAAQLHRVAATDRHVHEWLDTAQRFLRAAVGRDGMHNVLGFRRRWQDREYLGDHVGRTVWSAGVVASSGYGVDAAQRRHARDLLSDVWPMAAASDSPRTTAYTILGLTAGGLRPDGSREAVRDGAYRLDRAIGADPRWPWFDDRLTYDNARLPQALLAAGQFLGEPVLATHALDSLDWYLAQVGLAGPGPLVNVGAHGRSRDGAHKPRTDSEQPLETAALVDVLVDAWTATGRTRYARLARRAFAWFHGANRAATAVYDERTGGCHDGLTAGGVNANEGAESTLAYYQAALALDRAGLIALAAPIHPKIAATAVGERILVDACTGIPLAAPGGPDNPRVGSPSPASRRRIAAPGDTYYG